MNIAVVWMSKHPTIGRWSLLLLGVIVGAGATFIVMGRSHTIGSSFASPARPAILVPVSLAGVIDDRARFRQIFCALDADHGGQFPVKRSCSSALQQLGGEKTPRAKPIPVEPGRPLLHIVIVPGMFGQCVEKWALPLEDAAVFMKHQGYRVDILDVDGRSSSARNAQTIAHSLHSLLKPGERLLIIGYSKGMSDLLETLGLYPQVIPPGSAVVSLSGIVSGTPIAHHPVALDRLISSLPFATCGQGDEGAAESISRSHRIAWLADHPLPRDRSYFSVVAFTDKARISWPLEHSYRQLSTIDAHNDGQVLDTDAIIPGSHLLAYLNADHWAVALPLARNKPALRPLFGDRNDFPREILLEAIVRSVEEQIGQSGGQQK